MSNKDEPPINSDFFRHAAAAGHQQSLALGELATHFAELAALGQSGAEPLRQQVEILSKASTQLAEITAALAIAHDQMINAGGPDNSRAYVEYEATVRRLTALMPTQLQPPDH